eukprot:1148604-Pelagomonas_calceolata.AAC.7
MSESEPNSIFVGNLGEKEVHDVPMSVICRPIPSVLDQEKVLWVEDPPGSNYYFSLGGCHRWEAYTSWLRVLVLVASG